MECLNMYLALKKWQAFFPECASTYLVKSIIEIELGYKQTSIIQYLVNGLDLEIDRWYYANVPYKYYAAFT